MAPADTADNWKTHHRGLQAGEARPLVLDFNCLLLCVIVVVPARGKWKVLPAPPGPQNITLRGAGARH